MDNVRKTRIILAFLVAPASPVLAYYFFILPKPLVLILGLPLSYATAVIVGIPLFFRVLQHGQVTPNDCVRGGFIAGAVVPMAFTIISLAWRIVMSKQIAPLAVMLTGTAGAIVYGILGAIAGYAFYFIAGFGATCPTRDRHDR